MNATVQSCDLLARKEVYDRRVATEAGWAFQFCSVRVHGNGKQCSGGSWIYQSQFGPQALCYVSPVMRHMRMYRKVYFRRVAAVR